MGFTSGYFYCRDANVLLPFTDPEIGFDVAAPYLGLFCYPWKFALTIFEYRKRRKEGFGEILGRNGELLIGNECRSMAQGSFAGKFISEIERS